MVGDPGEQEWAWRRAGSPNPGKESFPSLGKLPPGRRHAPQCPGAGVGGVTDPGRSTFHSDTYSVVFFWKTFGG